MLKKISKLFLYLFLSVILLTGVVVGLAYVFKDSIIQLFVNEANKRIATKVTVDKIDIEFWQTFPYFSLDFKNIVVYEAIQNSTQKFAQAENLYVSLSFRDLLNREYKIKKLYIKNGNFNFKIDASGNDNFSIFKSSGEENDSKLVFDLSNIKIENVGLVYKDISSKNNYDVYLKNILAKFYFNNEDWEISLNGDLFSNELMLNNLTFFKNKSANIKSSIIYSEKNQSYKINPSELSIANAIFKVQGTLMYGSKAFADITFSEQNSDFQTIISFLPNKFSSTLSQYKSKGEVYFMGLIKGYFHRGNQPLVKVDFGCKNASFFHPDSDQGITNANFTGSFSNGGGLANAQSYFKLKNVHSMLEKKPLDGNLEILDLKDPTLVFDLKTSISAEQFFKMFPLSSIDYFKGLLNINIDFKGKLADIKSKNYQNLSSAGFIDLQNVAIKSKESKLGFNNLNGKFEFDKSDLKATTFNGTIGESDFEMSGSLKNIIPYLFYNSEKLEIQSNFKSSHINLDQLLDSNPSNSKAETKLFFPPKLIFELNASIDQLVYKKFKPQALKGNISLKDRVFTANGLQMKIGKASLEVNLNVKQKEDSSFSTATELKMSNMPVDSLYYITDNFGQKFITYDNLRGELNAEIKMACNLSKNLTINQNSVSSSIHMTIKNGALVNFAPMKKLSKFIDEEALENIKFSELKNNFIIANRMIFIPDMTIKSSINTIQVSGKHSFDNEFEYRLKIPLKNYKNKDNLNANDALEGDSFKGFYLYLIIKGNGDDYKVQYDKAAVKEKIKQKLNEEKDKFIELFKKDYAQKQQENEKPVEAGSEDLDLD
jgi:hypothetical protein